MYKTTSTCLDEHYKKIIVLYILFCIYFVYNNNKLWCINVYSYVNIFFLVKFFKKVCT